MKDNEALTCSDFLSEALDEAVLSARTQIANISEDLRSARARLGEDILYHTQFSQLSY